jgi:hypothetical protein
LAPLGVRTPADLVPGDARAGRAHDLVGGPAEPPHGRERHRRYPLHGAAGRRAVAGERPRVPRSRRHAAGSAAARGGRPVGTTRQ